MILLEDMKTSPLSNGFLDDKLLDSIDSGNAVKLQERKKEGNVLFNDALNTFYLRLYGITHMVKDHSDRERKPAATRWATLSD